MTDDRSRPLLGDILTRLHLVDDDQVRAALEYQQKSGKLFGESLLALEFIGEDDLSWALSSQLTLPFVAVTPEMVDIELVRRYPRDFLINQLVLPLVASDTVLSVVLADPTDRTTLARLERISNLELSVAVGTPSALKEALAHVFPDTETPAGEEKEISVAPGPVSIHSAVMGNLLDRAVSQGSASVHLDPDGDDFRVRFRDAAGTLSEGGQLARESMDELLRGLSSWLGRGTQRVPGVTEWEPPSESAGPPPFRALAVTGSRGISLTLVLGGIIVSADPGATGDEESWNRIHSLLGGRRGLVLAVAPQTAGRDLLLGRLLDGPDLAERRCCVITAEDIPVAKNQIHYAGGFGPDIVRTFSRMEGLDVLAGTFEGPESLTALAEAGATDRLVLAVFPGNSALGFLSRMLEAGVSAPLLADCLLGVVAGQIIPASGKSDPSRTVIETLMVGTPLRRALQDGGNVEELRDAARQQGFLEIATRAGTIESIPSAVLEDLRRNSYLEDAA